MAFTFGIGAPATVGNTGIVPTGMVPGSNLTVGQVTNTLNSAGQIINDGGSFASKVSGLLHSIGGIFGPTAHQKESAAKVQRLYDAALRGDAAAYSELAEIPTAKWPGDDNKWLRPGYERDMAAAAIKALATNAQFVAKVATSPLYKELKSAADNIRNDVATAVARIGSGAVQGAVDAITPGDGNSASPLVLPVPQGTLVLVGIGAAVLLLLLFKHKD